MLGSVTQPQRDYEQLSLRAGLTAPEQPQQISERFRPSPPACAAPSQANWEETRLTRLCPHLRDADRMLLRLLLQAARRCRRGTRSGPHVPAQTGFVQCAVDPGGSALVSRSGSGSGSRVSVRSKVSVRVMTLLGHEHGQAHAESGVPQQADQLQHEQDPGQGPGSRSEPASALCSGSLNFCSKRARLPPPTIGVRSGSLTLKNNEENCT